jgi:hypothetical protein
MDLLSHTYTLLMFFLLPQAPLKIKAVSTVGSLADEKKCLFLVALSQDIAIPAGSRGGILLFFKLFVPAKINRRGKVVSPSRLNIATLLEVDDQTTPQQLEDIARKRCGFGDKTKLLCIEEVTSRSDIGAHKPVKMKRSFRANSIQDGDILVWAEGSDEEYLLKHLRAHYADCQSRCDPPPPPPLRRLDPFAHILWV